MPDPIKAMSIDDFYRFCKEKRAEFAERLTVPENLIRIPDLNAKVVLNSFYKLEKKEYENINNVINEIVDMINTFAKENGISAKIDKNDILLSLLKNKYPINANSLYEIDNLSDFLNNLGIDENFLKEYKESIENSLKNYRSIITGIINEATEKLISIGIDITAKEVSSIFGKTVIDLYYFNLDKVEILDKIINSLDIQKKLEDIIKQKIELYIKEKLKKVKDSLEKNEFTKGIKIEDIVVGIKIEYISAIKSLFREKKMVSGSDFLKWIKDNNWDILVTIKFSKDNDKGEVRLYIEDIEKVDDAEYISQKFINELKAIEMASMPEVRKFEIPEEKKVEEKVEVEEKIEPEEIWVEEKKLSEEDKNNFKELVRVINEANLEEFIDIAEKIINIPAFSEIHSILKNILESMQKIMEIDETLKKAKEDNKLTKSIADIYRDIIDDLWQELDRNLISFAKILNKGKQTVDIRKFGDALKSFVIEIKDMLEAI